MEQVGPSCVAVLPEEGWVRQVVIGHDFGREVVGLLWLALQWECAAAGDPTSLAWDFVSGYGGGAEGWCSTSG